MVKFFQKILFHDISLKNYLTLHAKRNVAGSWIKIPCLNQGQGMKDLVAHLYTWSPPPPGLYLGCSTFELREKKRDIILIKAPGKTINTA